MSQHARAPAFPSQLNGPRPRPAYDTATLARLLRQGRDANGVTIASAMPRYKLSGPDIAALTAYLKTLSAHPDPGVDGETLRFAVIVTDQTPPAVRRAVIDTATAFVAQTNKGVVADRSRPNFSPYYRSDLAAFWRVWALDVWDLHGPQATWPKQLADLYATQPVFAVASSAAPGPWAPIASFCDQRRLPCLFPLTDLPAEAGRRAGYSLYLSGGLPLEAQVVAAYLARGAPPARIVQVAAVSPRRAVPAARLQIEAGRLAGHA